MVLGVRILKHSRVYGYTFLVSAIFTVGDNFRDFLFASLEVESHPDWGLLLTLLHSEWPNSSVALRTAKTLEFGHSECSRVEGKNLLIGELLPLKA